jgi:hypothetical protein
VGEQDQGGDEGRKNLWNVLVYNRIGQDIISSVMRVRDLRKKGVTVHLPIEADR